MPHMSLSIPNETSCEQAEAFSQIFWIIFNFLWLLRHSINFPVRTVLQTIGRLHYWLLLFSYGSDDITAQPFEKHLEWIDTSLLEIANLGDRSEAWLWVFTTRNSRYNKRRQCSTFVRNNFSFNFILNDTIKNFIAHRLPALLSGLYCRHFILMHCQRRRLIIASEHRGITHRERDRLRLPLMKWLSSDAGDLQFDWSRGIHCRFGIPQKLWRTITSLAVARQKFRRRMTHPRNGPPLHSLLVSITASFVNCLSDCWAMIKKRMCPAENIHLTVC